MKSKDSFLKVGTKIFNPTHIVSINLEFCDEDTKGVSISLSDGEFYIFEGCEAEVLKRYFMLGSLVVDLDNLYGNSKINGWRG